MTSIDLTLSDLEIPTLIFAKDQETLVYASPSFLSTFQFDDKKDINFQGIFGIPFKALIDAEKTLPTAIGNKSAYFKPFIQEVKNEGKDTYLLMLHNISDLKSSQKKLESAVEEASAMADMKSNFLATMSHEIRTPMQSIFGLLELIAEEKPRKSIMDMIGTAKESASGLLEILDDILDLAKMDAEKMELDDFEVPIRLLARGTLEALAARKGNKNVALLDDISSDVPFVIKGDPKRLRQIIMNLVSNAIKFTKDGSITLKIDTKTQHIKQPKEGIAIRFEVIDTGIGMSKEVCDRLFNAFTQADNSTSREYGGTGLGLSICKKLVTLMDGEIGVESELGEGSTFWFEIPAEAVSTDQTTVVLPDLEGVAVLAVEDHPQGGKEIENSLRSMGAEVILVDSYEKGLEMMRKRPFDVAVVDQGLPDGLGIDLLKEAAEIRPFMGQIIYTVRDDYGLQHSCRALGATYLSKPASRAGLGEAVKDTSKKLKQHELKGPKKLLIADDNVTVREVLERQLKLLKVDADFVTDGRKALEAMGTGKYGILITDLHMPDIDGYGVIREIRQQEAFEDGHTPVIVLTADVQMAQRQAYLTEGFDECLLKPVSLGQIRRLLIRWGLMDEDEGMDVATAAAAPLEEPAEQLPIIDLKAMQAQMGAVNEDTLKMIGMFLDMTKPMIEDIIKAHKDGDNDKLKEAAHSLKGAARSACCMALGQVAADVQEAVETNEPVDAFIPKIKEEFEKIAPELKKCLEDDHS